MRTIIAVLALCLVSSVAFAGTMSGITHDINGNPVGGVKIWSPYETVYSAADGTYSVNIGSNGNNNTFFSKAGYTQPVRFQEDGLGDSSIVRNWTISPLTVGRTVVDDFSGDGYIYGRPTQDAGAYLWKTGLAAAADQTVGGALAIATPSDGNAGTIGIGANQAGEVFKAGDFIFTAKFRPTTTNTKYMIDYRRTNPDGAYYQYGEFLAFGWGGIVHGNNLNSLYGGPGTGGWGSSVVSSFDANVAHDITLRANGYQQDLYVDGVNVWSIFSPQPETVYDGYPWPYPSHPDYENCYAQDGYFAISSFGSLVNVDSVNIQELVPTAVPEPGSIVALLSGLVGVVGFARRRRA